MLSINEGSDLNPRAVLAWLLLDRSASLSMPTRFGIVPSVQLRLLRISMPRNISSLTHSFSFNRATLALTAASAFMLLSWSAQAKGVSNLATSLGNPAEPSIASPGVNYGFDARCGVDSFGRADLWKFGSARQTVTGVDRRIGCSLDGDQGSAHFRCYCAHQDQSLAGTIDASKIPSLRSFERLDTSTTRDKLVGLCEETFQAQCGPLAEPQNAECGTPTKNFCRVQTRGDLKGGWYNLFDEFCHCQGKRTWWSAQRLSAALGTLSTSAEDRCQAQLASCSAGQDPSFAPVQMLNHKGYTDQEYSCGSVVPEKYGNCKVKPSKDGERVEFECVCEGAHSGGSIPKKVHFGAKSLNEACVSLLQRQCSEIWDPEDEGEDCDTSSSSDDDCENAETSSADDGSGSDDSVDPNEGPTETGPGEAGPQPNPGDVLDSLGCSAKGAGSGGWGAVFGFGVLLLLVRRSDRLR